MRTKFERAIALTAFVGVGLPVVGCLVAQSWAGEMLGWFGFLYQVVALGMAAYELNNLDVRTFKGPGFLRRMGWRPHPPVNIQLTGSTATVTGAIGGLSVEHQDHSVDARLKRLEAAVESLNRADQKLSEAIHAEAKSRKEADQALNTELRTELGSMDAKLKEASLGELEWVYAALLIALVGTVLSTFNEQIGHWFQ